MCTNQTCTAGREVDIACEAPQCRCVSREIMNLKQLNYCQMNVAVIVANRRIS